VNLDPTFILSNDSLMCCDEVQDMLPQNLPPDIRENRRSRKFTLPFPSWKLVI
jgi:hypothetical protein